MSTQAIDYSALADLLSMLGAVASVTPAKDAAPIFQYAAALIRLGEEARTRRTVLVTYLKKLVSEKRGPTETERLEMTARRAALDDELAVVEADLIAQIGGAK